MSTRLLLACALLVTLACAQERAVSVGVAGGLPVAPFFESQDGIQGVPGAPYFRRQSYSETSHRVCVGPMVRVALPHSFSLEADALYQRLSFTVSNTTLDLNGYSSLDFMSSTANRWQFPVLLRYGLPRRKLHPFVGAGASLSNVQGGRHEFLVTSTGPSGSHSSGSSGGGSGLLRQRSVLGVVASAGIRTRLSVAEVSPSLRYTLWTAQQFEGRGDTGGRLRSHRSQLDFMIGITF